jgi:hypothetical protein
MRLFPARLQRHLQPDRHWSMAPFAAKAAPKGMRCLCESGLDGESPLLEAA